jgi:hypothetical protein
MKRDMSYRIRMMLKSATTKASAKHTVTGQKKTTYAPKPVTLAKVAQK